MNSYKISVVLTQSGPTWISTDIFVYEVSEWLLFNANSVIYQLYHGRNRLIFKEMMMRSTLY